MGTPSSVNSNQPLTIASETVNTKGLSLLLPLYRAIRNNWAPLAKSVSLHYIQFIGNITKRLACEMFTRLQMSHLFHPNCQWMCMLTHSISHLCMATSHQGLWHGESWVVHPVTGCGNTHRLKSFILISKDIFIWSHKNVLWWWKSA